MTLDVPPEAGMSSVLASLAEQTRKGAGVLASLTSLIFTPEPREENKNMASLLSFPATTGPCCHRRRLASLYSCPHCPAPQQAELAL